MKHRVSAVVVAALIFCAVAGARTASCTEGFPAMPHTVTLELSPSYVTAGSTARLIATLIPCVDVESLYVSISLPAELRTDPDSVRIVEWRQKAKKGERVVVGGEAVFREAGVYVVVVSYWHRDPRFKMQMRGNLINFPISIPGGLMTGQRAVDKLPYQVKEAPEGTPDTTLVEGQVRVLQAPPGSRIGSPRCPQPKRDPEIFRTDSIVSASVALRPSGTILWHDTVRVIATCDTILAEIRQGNIVDLANWRVVPSLQDSILELPDHRARFIAGPTGGVGRVVYADEGVDITHAWPIMVIANYSIQGFWWYEGEGGEYELLPVIHSVVKLYTVDSQSNDLISSTCYSQQFHYRLVDSTYTDSTGFFEFGDLNVDSIMIRNYTSCPSHEVGLVSGGYWYKYFGGYCSFGVACYMTWPNPVYWTGALVHSGTYTGAWGSVPYVVENGLTYSPLVL